MAISKVVIPCANEEIFSNYRKAEEIIRVLFNLDFELDAFYDYMKNDRAMADLTQNKDFSACIARARCSSKIVM